MLKTVYIGKYLWLMERQTDSRIPVVMLDRRLSTEWLGFRRTAGKVG